MKPYGLRESGLLGWTGEDCFILLRYSSSRRRKQVRRTLKRRARRNIRVACNYFTGRTIY